MVEVEIALIQARQNNIRRYHKLLKTRLTDLEREYIEWRLSEERSALQASTAQLDESPQPRRAEDVEKLRAVLDPVQQTDAGIRTSAKVA
jgi:hypothetical protein